MICVSFHRDLNLDTNRGSSIRLRAGTPYLLSHYHAGRQVPEALCSRREVYTHAHLFTGEPLDARSLLIVWLAGMGDTIAACPAMLALQSANPGARIDVVSDPLLHEIFAAAGLNCGLIHYPCTRELADGYDLFRPIEQTSLDPDRLRLHSIDFRAKLLGLPPGLAPFAFKAGPASRARMRLPSAAGPRVGVQVRGLSPIRTYPLDLMAEVLRELIRAGCEVHLLGERGDADAAPAPPWLYNHCGRTRRFEDLVALVEQMDVVVCPDSLLLHLAGSMGVPAVALMSTMPAHLRAGRYGSVTALEPSAECAPCQAILDHACPLGHGACAAMRSATMSPDRILQAIDHHLAAARMRTLQRSGCTSEG